MMRDCATRSIFMTPVWRAGLALAIGAGALAPQCAHAQIRTDASLGRVAQTVQGPNYILPESLGRLAGSNLFHSFSVFNINTGQSATFTTSTPGIANVISRVTGGSPSMINGPLALNAASGTPGFFFINPSGVLFGAGASISVPGAFHVTTADYIKFADGKFFADANAASVLSSAPPEAFGFLGTARATVGVKDGARLATNLLQPFSIVAGDIEIDGGNVATRGGDIRILALGQRNQEVSLAGPLPAAEGRLVITNGGQIFAPSIGTRDAGNVRVSAGSITIDGQGSSTFTGILSQAETDTTGNAGEVNVTAAGNLSVLNGGGVASSTFASGNAGAVLVNAGSITIDRQTSSVATGIFSQARLGSAGSAGEVDVTAEGNLSIVNGGVISSSTFSSGNAGAVTVNARSITIDRGASTISTGIFSQANPGSSGSAGEVNVSAAGNLSVLNGGVITSSTFASGNAGAVRVNAGSIAIDRQTSSAATGIFSQANSGSTGSAGEVDVTAEGNLSIVNGGALSSSTFSSGNAGLVTVNARSITIDRGASTISTGIFSQANPGSSGSAGEVNVSATGNLLVLNGGVITSSTFASGNAGAVLVNAGNITIDRQTSSAATGILSQANPGSTGNAGLVNVTTAGSLSVLNGGVINSSTSTEGNAGSVTVNAGSITIDRGGSTSSTGIFSQANPGSSGSAGEVNVSAAGNLSVLNGGVITSSTFALGNAGAVRVNAGSITIDRQTSSAATGIFSQAEPGSMGIAGEVNVTATGNLSVLNGGVVSSSTFAPGDAGTVKVSAGSITIDSRGSISSSAAIPTSSVASSSIVSTGNAGNVEVTAKDSLSVLNGGQIRSNTSTNGNAGSVTVNAGSITIDRGGSTSSTGIFSQANSGSTGSAGEVNVTTAGSLSVLNGGAISSSTFAEGNAGSVTVHAESITIDSQGYAAGGTGIFSQANFGSTGSAGKVNVTTAGDLSVLNGGQISSDTFSSGDAGSVTVNAGAVTIDGQGSSAFTGISSDALGSTGNAGAINVTAAGNLSVVNGGVISSDTFSFGDAGSVKVTADRITIEGRGRVTGIFSRAREDSFGNAGSVAVTARGNLSVIDGAEIASSTFSRGNAGSVMVNADGITIDSRGFYDFATGIFSQAERGSVGRAGAVTVTATGNLSVLDAGEIASSTFSFGDAGSVRVNAGSVTIDRRGGAFATGILSQAESGSTGNAGAVEVTAVGNLSVINGGVISSTTFSVGDAGPVKVSAENITIDSQGYSPFLTGIISQANFDSQGGNAGSVEVSATGNLSVLNGGVIGSDTFSFGNAGSVKVSARNLTIDAAGNSQTTGIVSRAGEFSFGNAGSVDVRATEDLRVQGGGTISSRTASFGDAGSVTVTAGSLSVDGRLDADHPSSINALAGILSLGQTGNVSVIGTNSITLSNGGELSITNSAQVPAPGSIVPTLLTVSAPEINLNSGGQITAASSGNIAASNIQVDFGSRLVLTDSAITTSAQDGNGGAIQIIGSGVLSLHNAQITTSVLGLSGNGGDISVKADALALNTGFIQANTGAANARGGNVTIDVQTLVPSGNSLSVGGQTVFSFQPGVFGSNVIQAAAPTGVSGNIQITTPALDVSGTLSGLNAKVIDTGGLGRSLCQTSGGSSLAQTGRGGLPPSARDLLRFEPMLPADASGRPITNSTFGHPYHFFSNLGCPGHTGG